MLAKDVILCNLRIGLVPPNLFKHMIFFMRNILKPKGRLYTLLSFKEVSFMCRVNETVMMDPYLGFGQDFFI
jgi:hypothetical protein